jgi:hypothetical protein
MTLRVAAQKVWEERLFRWKPALLNLDTQYALFSRRSVILFEVFLNSAYTFQAMIMRLNGSEQFVPHLSLIIFYCLW